MANGNGNGNGNGNSAKRNNSWLDWAMRAIIGAGFFVAWYALENATAVRLSLEPRLAQLEARSDSYLTQANASIMEREIITQVSKRIEEMCVAQARIVQRLDTVLERLVTLEASQPDSYPPTSYQIEARRWYDEIDGRLDTIEQLLREQPR
jgi:hypothetical protein